MKFNQTIGASLIAISQAFGASSFAQGVEDNQHGFSTDAELPGLLYAERKFTDLSQFTNYSLSLAPYVIYADPNHSKPAFDDFVGSAALRDAMQTAGRDCIAYEFPEIVDNGLLDALRSGTMLPSEAAQISVDNGMQILHRDGESPLQLWTQNFESIKAFIDAGINVHFVDPDKPEQNALYARHLGQMEIYRNAENYFANQYLIQQTGHDLLRLGMPEDPELQQRIQGLVYFYKASGQLSETINRFVDTINETTAAWQRARFDDKQLAENIQAVSDGECVITYGAGHGENNYHDQDLDEYLGEENTVRIYIYGTMDGYLEEIAIPENNGSVGNDHPELIFIAETNTAYATEAYLQSLGEKQELGQSRLSQLESVPSPL